MKFNWEEFKESKFAVLLTKDNYRDFISQCCKNDIKPFYHCTITTKNHTMYVHKYNDCSKLKSNEFILSCFKLYDEYRLQFDEATTNIVRWNNNLAKQEKSYMEQENKQEKTIWEQIAEYLGVKIDEEFRIEGGGDSLYRVNDEEGFQFYSSARLGWFTSNALHNLLCGKLKIKKDQNIKLEIICGKKIN